MLALSLSYKEGESIFIGEEIEILISKIEGKQVKVSISAPESIDI